MFKEYLNLIRVRQWYKNLVIFLAIFSVGKIFDLDLLTITLLGFISLCLISSATYVINDLVDIKKDQAHPEKKYRPLASGKIKKWKAIILLIFFVIISLTLSWILSLTFFYTIIFLFILSQIYSFFLKNVLFADILTISTLFVIRAISGAYLINVTISPWLILCPFFIALLLVTGKRHSDVSLLKEKATKTRKVLKGYTDKVTSSLIIVATTLLTMSYALYCFFSIHADLFYTLPFFLFIIFRYYYLAYSGSEIARHPEKFVKDKPLIMAIIISILLFSLLVYW